VNDVSVIEHNGEASRYLFAANRADRVWSLHRLRGVVGRQHGGNLSPQFRAQNLKTPSRLPALDLHEAELVLGVGKKAFGPFGAVQAQQERVRDTFGW